MRFTAYNQFIHKMLSRWGPNVREYTAIKKYLKTQSIDLDQPPAVRIKILKNSTKNDQFLAKFIEVFLLLMESVRGRKEKIIEFDQRLTNFLQI